MGESACRGIVDVAAGRIPRFIVNRDALLHPRLQARLRDTENVPAGSA